MALPGADEKMASIGKALLRCFAGEITEGQLCREVEKIVKFRVVADSALPGGNKIEIAICEALLRGSAGVITDGQLFWELQKLAFDGQGIPEAVAQKPATRSFPLGDLSKYSG
jgi:hypothetical protein